MSKSSKRAKPTQGFKRRPPFRKERDRVLIVTEGSKTEPDYFKRLIDELQLTTAKVNIVTDSGSAPINVVNRAIQILKQDDDFEQVYCVFDRDVHSTYDSAISKLKQTSEHKKFKKKVIQVITSVPCFEVWYLLHVSKSTKPYGKTGTPCNTLINDLKKSLEFSNYNKADCGAFFEAISGKRGTAICRAKRFLLEANGNGQTPYHEDPSTRVHEIVEALTKIAEN